MEGLGDRRGQLLSRYFSTWYLRLQIPAQPPAVQGLGKLKGSSIHPFIRSFVHSFSKAKQSKSTLMRPTMCHNEFYTVSDTVLYSLQGCVTWDKYLWDNPTISTPTYSSLKRKKKQPCLSFSSTTPLLMAKNVRLGLDCFQRSSRGL